MAKAKVAEWILEGGQWLLKRGDEVLRRLDPTDVRMQRADDTGYTGDWYHSTKSDFEAFDANAGESRRGSDFGFHVGSKEAAENAIMPDWMLKYQQDIIENPASTPDQIERAHKAIGEYYNGAQILPLQVKAENPVTLPDFGRWDAPSNARAKLFEDAYYHGPPRLKPDLDTSDPDLAQELLELADSTSDKGVWEKGFGDALRRRGYDSVKYKNTTEGGESLMLLEPSQLRSRFADFLDPDSSNLLAGLKGAAPIGLAAALSGQSQDADASAAKWVLEGGQWLLKRGDEVLRRMPDSFREPSDNAFAKGMTKADERMDWLQRHKVKTDEEGRYIFHHGTPKSSNLADIREGSLLETNPEAAARYATHDRGLDISDADVHEVRVYPDELGSAGVWATLGKNYKLAAPIGLAAALSGQSQDADAGPVRVLSHIDDAGKAVYKTAVEAWHGSPHKFPSERLVRNADGTEEYIVGGVDQLPDIPAGAEVIEDYPLGRFRMDKIGTGEGAQAKGYGSYHADARDTGISYRDTLSAAHPDDSYRIVMGLNDKLGAGLSAREASWIENGIRHGKPTDEIIDDFVGAFPEWAGVDEGSFNTLRRLADEGKAAMPEGALYRTQLDVDPDQLLDWDKPLSDEFIDYLKSQGVDDVMPAKWTIDDFRQGQGRARELTGEDFYKTLNLGMVTDGGRLPVNTAPREGAADAARWLNGAGIPGSKHLDGFSRNVAGDANAPHWNLIRNSDGVTVQQVVDPNSVDDVLAQAPNDFRLEGPIDNRTYNYVMFDDAPINILERGAADPATLAYTAAVTGAVGAYNEYRYQQQAKTTSLRETVGNALAEIANADVSGGDWGPYAAAIAWTVPLLDMPMQGIMGIGATGVELAQGGSWEDAVRQGAQIAQQPPEQTSYDLGGMAVDSMSGTALEPYAPAVGTAIHTGILMGSPF